LTARTTARLVRHIARERDGRPRLQVTLRRGNASAAVALPPPETAPHRQLTLLLVEPDRILRRNLTRLLQHARVAVLPVSEGRSATETLQTAARAGVRFHAVVMNARLRDTTSMALVHEVRLLVPNLPILLICAPRTPLPFGRVSQNTPVLPLVKPVSWAQIAAGLERAVRALYPGESIVHASTGGGVPAEQPADASAEPVHDESAAETAQAVVAVHS
jgi:DNA-binding response OmpR family regulator